MGTPPFFLEGCALQYFYEGKTIRGVGWIQSSLWAFLALHIATILLSVGLASVISTTLSTDPFAAFPSLMGLLYVACGLVILMIVGFALFLAGLGPLYAGRREYGARHARNMGWSLGCFIATAVCYVAQSAVSSNSLTFLPPTATVSSSATIGLALAAGGVLRALFSAFAGLTLLFGIYAFADAAGARRLILALILGIVGSVAGSVISIVGLYTLAPSQYGPVLIANALGGTGVGLIAMVLYFLVYREISGRLRSGAIPAALPPRPPIPWPYYYPPYPYRSASPPAAPASPPPPPPSPPQP